MNSANPVALKGHRVFLLDRTFRTNTGGGGVRTHSHKCLWRPSAAGDPG
jgi:hypothetical protein